MIRVYPSKLYNLRFGALISAFLTISILPVRLSEGQGSDAFNLIGSEITIATMCLTIWVLTNRVYHRMQAPAWQKIVLCMLLCAIVSNLFYYASNPVFEDYPLKPMRTLPLWLATLRLSLRGLLIGLIIIPIVFLLENEKRAQRARIEKEQQRAEQAEQQQRLLEGLVRQRTQALEQTLSTLEASRGELDNQVYVLSRVVASITHDVKSPLKYVMFMAKRINLLLEQEDNAVVREYVHELSKSLDGISSMMDHLLEFTKGQLRKDTIHLSQVDLAGLVRDKMRLFEGIADNRNNTLEINLDSAPSVVTNYNLASVIVHNLLDNATKYTRNGQIKISAGAADHGLRLRVENTSSNMQGSLSEHAEINTDNGETIFRSNGDGIGLLLVREIAALLNIKFSIKASKSAVIADVMFPNVSNN